LLISRHAKEHKGKENLMNVLKQHFTNAVDEDVNPSRKNRLHVAFDIAAAVRFIDIDYR
jgi:hypothetical protein